MSNMVVNTNVAALDSHRNMKKVGTAQFQAAARLSSGLRINSAADDAAGLAISEKMRSQIRGLDMASRNAQDGISLIQTAEGGMQEIDNMLQRMRELLVAAANDTNDNGSQSDGTINATQGDRRKIQDELDQLAAEIDKMAERVEFNKKKLINGVFDGKPTSTSTTTDVGAKFDVQALIDALAAIDGSYDIPGTPATPSQGAADANALFEAGEIGDVLYELIANSPILSELQTGGEYATEAANILAAIDIVTAAGNSATKTQVKAVLDAFGDLDTAVTSGSVAYGDIGMPAATFADAVRTALQIIHDDATADYWGTAVVPDATGNVLDDIIGTAAQTAFDTGGTHAARAALVEASLNALNAFAGTGTEDENRAALKTLLETAINDLNGLKIAINGATADADTWDGTNVGFSQAAFDSVLAEYEAVLADFDARETQTDGTDIAGKSLWFQIGANAEQGFLVNIGSVKTDTLQIGNGNGELDDNIEDWDGVDITKLLDKYDDALTTVTTERSKLGAYQNRLEYAIKSLDLSSENLAASESRIRDADIGKEMMNLTKANVLQQAATSMLAQANQNPQMVLQLLR